jgi:hypothetical protein
MERTTGSYDTFIVKIWRAEGVMRGRIEHVGTQEYTYFLRLDKMIDFIKSRHSPAVNDFGILDEIQGSRGTVSDDFGDIGSDE